MNKIEKKIILNENLRIFAEIRHPVQEVTPDELAEMMRNLDDHTIINVIVGEEGDE